MPDVLIRDVPPDDLDQIRTAALQRGTSLQGYLRETVHAQAVYLRRQAALAQISNRLSGQRPVPDDERQAVLAAVDRDNDERADELGRRSAR